jgi:MFS family permease
MATESASPADIPLEPRKAERRPEADRSGPFLHPTIRVEIAPTESSSPLFVRSVSPLSEEGVIEHRRTGGPAGGPAPDGRQRGRAARAATVGTLLEYYDFTLYAGAAATVFPQVFFPGSSPFAASLQAIGTFSIAFLVRPIAAYYLGSLGDRIGRRKILTLTLMIMGVATFLIGLVPSHASIGVAAPILLIVLRVAQGIGAAGEYGGAVIVAFEFAPEKRRGFYGSLPGLGVNLGGALGSILLLVTSAVVSGDQFLSWGWRVPFLLGGALAGYALYVRMRLPETPAFKNVEESGSTSRSPLLDALRNQPRVLATMLFCMVSVAGLGYFYVAFAVSYASNTVGLSRTATFAGLLVGYIAQGLCVPFFGWLSDLVGRRTVIVSGFVFAGAMAFPFFALIRPVPVQWNRGGRRLRACRNPAQRAASG